MNWKRSATGNWVSYFAKRRFVIESLACWEAKKQVRRYRLRVDGSAVGGVRPVLYKSVAGAKRAAGEIQFDLAHVEAPPGGLGRTC